MTQINIFYHFPSQTKRLIASILTVLIVFNILSGPPIYSTWVDRNHALERSFCSTSNLLNSDQTNPDSETSHCSLCLLNNKINLLIAASNNIFFASSQLSCKLPATVSIQPYRIATFTFNSQAPPKII